VSGGGVYEVVADTGVVEMMLDGSDGVVVALDADVLSGSNENEPSEDDGAEDVAELGTGLSSTFSPSTMRTLVKISRYRVDSGHTEHDVHNVYGRRRRRRVGQVADFGHMTCPPFRRRRGLHFKLRLGEYDRLAIRSKYDARAPCLFAGFLRSSTLYESRQCIEREFHGLKKAREMELVCEISVERAMGRPALGSQSSRWGETKGGWTFQ
jgi:hypothetical protein